MPHLEQLQSELGDRIKTFKINAFENSEISAQFRVMAVPTVILFRNGQAAAKWTGVTAADVIKAKLGLMG